MDEWYAIRSKPRKEDMVWQRLISEGLEVFYPRIRVNPVNPRSKKIKPYFPGYMFVRVDIGATGLSYFQWMPHTLGLVNFGGEPAQVPDNLIHELKQQIERIAAAGGLLFDGLQPGDAVRINSGPFAGYSAIFDSRIPGSERVRVLLELLSNQRRVPIELPAGQIEKTKPRK